jgi:hypothetical protein
MRVSLPTYEEFTARLASDGVPLTPFSRQWRSWTRPATAAERTRRVAEFIAEQYETVATAAEGCHLLLATAMSHFVAQTLLAVDRRLLPRRSPRNRAKAIDEDSGRPVGGDRRELDDRVRAFGDRQLAGVVVHVGGGELAVRDLSRSGDIELNLRERLSVSDSDHVQRRFRRAVGELVNFREGLLWVGHDREGTAAAGHHHHPRMIRRLQQGKERMRDPDRPVHVGVIRRNESRQPSRLPAQYPLLAHRRC